MKVHILVAVLLSGIFLSACKKGESKDMSEPYIGNYAATDTVTFLDSGGMPHTNFTNYIFSIKSTGPTSIELINFNSSTCTYKANVTNTDVTLTNAGATFCTLSNFAGTFDGTKLRFSYQVSGATVMSYKGEATKQ